MGRGIRRQAPALVIAGLALVAALSGTVYAAGKINGRTIKVKSLPGNRLALGSVPGNRLKPGAIKGSQLAPGSITGIQIDASTLGQVPSAIHAETAESAHDAETALNARQRPERENRQRLRSRLQERAPAPFAGACWQIGGERHRPQRARGGRGLRRPGRRAARRALAGCLLAAAGGDAGDRG